MQETKLAAVLLLGLLVAAGASADTAGAARIQIVKAIYGRPGAASPRDFSERLQQTCGDKSEVCESYCSQALVGPARSTLNLPFAPRPVCRVIYRCGESQTRATEADNNDTLVLSCREVR